MEFAGEAIEESAGRAFGEEAAGTLTPEAVESMAKSVADGMGVSVEDIGKLPEETQQAFKDQLTKAFEDSGISIKNGQFEVNFPKTLQSNLGSAKINFISDVKTLAQEQGFSPLKQETLVKFGAEADVLSNFPEKITVAEPTGFSAPTEIETPGEKVITDAETAVKNAKSDVEYAQTQLKDDTAIKTAQDNLVKAQTQLDSARDADITQKETTLKQAQSTESTAQEKLKTDQAKGADQNTIEQDKQSLNQAQDQTTAANEEKVVSERTKALNKYNEATQDYNKAQEDVKVAKKELADAQDQPAKDAAQEKLKTAQEQERVTKDNYDAAKKEWIEKSDRFEALGLKFKEKAITIIKEQLISNLIAGFTFAIPNFVIGPIQEELNRKAQLSQLQRPQRFGNIWMQIPQNLLNYWAPLSSKPFYVGINQPSTAEVSQRSTDGDTDTFLQNANYYVSITDYDDYATTAITDPNFSNQMVHLNTGYHFIGDGLPADAKSQTIAFLNADDRSRLKPLQYHLDDMAGSVRHGVSGEVYEENRDQETGYKGSQTIADQLDQEKNMTSLYALPSGFMYGKVLDGAIALFANSTAFGPYKLSGFKALSDDQMRQIASGQSVQGAKNYPYVAWSVPPKGYVYQTQDTPDMQAIIKQLGANNPLSKIATDYVVLYQDAQDPLVPLLLPSGTGSSFGTPTYQLNANAKDFQMVSLLSGKMYSIGGKVTVATPDFVKNIISFIDGDIAEQVAWMQKFYQDQWAVVSQQLKYGPFKFGNTQLSIDKASVDKGVFIYKVDSPLLENGANDYVVAIGLDENQKPIVVQLPNDNVLLFVSVISSRFYDISFAPFKKNVTFWVYKTPLGNFVLATGPQDTQKGEPLFSGTAPQYSVFMDPEVNPTQPTPDQQAILVKAGAQTAQGDPTAASKVLPLPEQWALSSQGLFVDRTNNIHLGDFLGTNAPLIRAMLDQAHTAWKTVVLQDPQLIKIELGPYRFTTDLVRNILLNATSMADIKNGNYIYTSAQYPNEFLALSSDTDGTSADFATEYNLSSPQRYAISLSSGNVYDGQAQGQLVKKLTTIDQLVQKAQRTPFLPALLSKIKSSQTAYYETLAQQQYGPDTEFGRFKFYINQDDLKNGYFVYGDVTNIKNPLSMDPKALASSITNYFVAIEGPVDDATRWVYGNKLNPNTTLVLSLITGALYDRGGSFQQNLRMFGQGLDITQGFIEKIFALLEKTWGQSFGNSALRSRIVSLTQSAYDTIQKERKQIADEQEAEAKIFAPLNANLKANLDSAAYIQDLTSMTPARYIKLYNNKYYFVSPDAPKVYIDYNVGDAGKDNNVGMSYDAQGNAVARLRGWSLANLRAYAGIVVNPDGSQKLDLATDHPSMPIDSMVKVDAGGLQKVIELARISMRGAYNAYLKNPANETLNQAYLNAAIYYNTLKLVAESAQAVKNANLPTSPKLSYEFYYNTKISAYFVKVTMGTKQYYIDLVAGYVFNLDGAPRLRENQTFINKDSTKKDLFFVGQDSQGLFTAAFIGNDGLYHSWTTANVVRAADGKSYKYTVGNNDDGSVAYIVQSLNDDGSAKQYDIWIEDALTDQLELVSSYLPGVLFDSQMRYARTNGTYVSTDNPLNPVLIVWDGNPDLTLQMIMYKQNLISLKSSGANQYTGSYTNADGTTGQIAVTKQQKAYSPLITAHWLSIVDGGKTFDYLYDTSILEPDEPTTCPVGASALERTKLNYWKQCAWKLNAVVDSRGLNRLVNNVPTADNLAPIDISMVKGVPNNNDVKNILQSSLSRLFYDPAHNRYVFLLASAQDSGWGYYQERLNNWYVDLATGILFDPTTASVGAYPTVSLMPSQLDTLLARLGVSVAPVPDPNGTPAFDQFGNPIMVNKVQVKLNPGLVYKGASKQTAPILPK